MTSFDLSPALVYFLLDEGKSESVTENSHYLKSLLLLLLVGLMVFVLIHLRTQVHGEIMRVHVNPTVDHRHEKITRGADVEFQNLSVMMVGVGWRSWLGKVLYFCVVRLRLFLASSRLKLREGEHEENEGIAVVEESVESVESVEK
jgi:hypothetical protein